MSFISDYNNPNSIRFYLIYIFSLIMAYLVLILFTKYIKKRINTFQASNGNNNKKYSIENLSKEQLSLRFRFLLVSTTIKAAVWVKAPYIFALYNRLHGFTRGDIGILYAIDNLSALVTGPIFGSLGDLYGRKKLCVFYCLVVISQISLRLMGNQALAYIAQFLTGLSGSLIDTAFESWLNFEASLLFEDTHEGKQMKILFLREIFSKQVNIDCFTSIILTSIASLLYIKFGLKYPFYACIFFVTLAGIFILICWKENDIEKLRLHMLGEHKHGNELHLAHLAQVEPTSFMDKLKTSWECLKEDKALLSLGVIESCFKISLQLFIFIWTPLLEETVGGFINPGSIFVCFMISRLMGSELFELFKIFLQTNSYSILMFINATACTSFFIDYSLPNFTARFLMFVYFDGLSGIFNPLLSSLKSQMIPEKLRNTIMNFFRIPINVFSILSLVLTNYITTYQICLVTFGFMLIGSIVNIYLLFIHQPPDHKERLAYIYHKSQVVNEIARNN